MTMTISKELLDELLKGCERPEDLLCEAGLMKELKIGLEAHDLIQRRPPHLERRGSLSVTSPASRPNTDCRTSPSSR